MAFVESYGSGVGLASPPGAAVADGRVASAVAVGAGTVAVGEAGVGVGAGRVTAMGVGLATAGGVDGIGVGEAAGVGEVPHETSTRARSTRAAQGRFTIE